MEDLSKQIDVLIPIIKERELNCTSQDRTYKQNGQVRCSSGKEQKNIGHLPLGETGRFSKTIFYFLKCDCNDCKVKIADGKAVNLGDGVGMRVP